MRTTIGYWVLLTILLSSIVSFSCGGDDMGFAKRRHNGWADIPYFGAVNGEYLDDDEATEMITNSLFVRSHAIHNLMYNSGHLPQLGSSELYDVVFVVSPGVTREIVSIPLNGVYSGAGRRIRIWIKAHRADASSPAYLIAWLDRKSTKVYIDGAASTHAWYLIEVTVNPVVNPAMLSDARLTIQMGVDWSYGVGNEETVTVRAISINEGYRKGYVDRYKDTTHSLSKIGEPDFPWSVGMQRVLVGNLIANYQGRMNRSNIMQKNWLEARRTITSSYSSDENEFGEWVIRKSWGTNQLEGLYIAWVGDDVDVRVGIWAMDSLYYDNEVAGFTAGNWITGTTSGARALIVAIQDLGSTGYLYLSYVDGTFQNNETIEEDTSSGEALVNGANLGPRKINDHDATMGSSDKWDEFAFAGLLNHEAEYMLRMDAKISGGSSATVCVIPSIFVAESLGSDIDMVPPNPVRTEEDDDVIGTTWARLNAMLNELYARRRQVVLTESRSFRSSLFPLSEVFYFDTMSCYTRIYCAGDKWIGNTAGHGLFGFGPLFSSKHVHEITARVWIRRVAPDSYRRLDVTSASGVSYGIEITGGTSGATATVYDYDLTTGDGTFSIREINGAFVDGETITWSGGSATVDGNMYHYEAQQKLRLAVYRDETPVDVYDRNLIDHYEVDISRMTRGRRSLVELRLKVSPEMWGDMSVDPTDNNPYLWAVNAITSDAADFVMCDALQVFETSLLPGGWILTGEDAE